MEFTTTTIKDLEVLTSLPANIAALPKSPELQYISKSGKAEQPKVMAITPVDPDTGVAVPDVRVEVRLNAQPLQKLRTDAQGALSIPLPTDEVTSLSLKALLSKASPAAPLPGENTVIRLGSPGLLSRFNCPGSPVAGRVVDENGQPIAGATVATSLQRRPRTAGVFGDRCAFPQNRDENQRAGRVVAAPTFRLTSPASSTVSALPATEPPPTAALADFRRDSGLSYASLRDGPATIKLGHGLRLSGKITDPDGRPVEKCRLTIGQDIWGTNCPVAESSAQGEYSLPGLSPGKTWITAEAPGHQPPPAKSSFRSRKPPSISLSNPTKSSAAASPRRTGNPALASISASINGTTSALWPSAPRPTPTATSFWNGAPDARRVQLRWLPKPRVPLRPWL